MNPADPLYVFGPVGCGKTSSIKQLAARLNYPVFEVTGHGRLEFADLVGHLAVKDGNMTFEYGPLALAMRFGGMCLVNEIDLTPPEVLAGLNTILDGYPLCIAENGGELITPHPQFRFVATANTTAVVTKLACIKAHNGSILHGLTDSFSAKLGILLPMWRNSS